jgi:hypothetical protein
VAASIPHSKVWEECRNSGQDGRLEAVASSIHLEAVAASIQLEAAMAVTLKSARLRETLPKASRVLDSYENVIETPEKTEVCLTRSYLGISNEARKYKHNTKHTIP